jgi:hypothetical protein
MTNNAIPPKTARNPVHLVHPVSSLKFIPGLAIFERTGLGSFLQVPCNGSSGQTRVTVRATKAGQHSSLGAGAVHDPYYNKGKNM